MLKTALLTSLLLFTPVSLSQAQTAGDIIGVQVLCEDVEDALVGASKGATEGKEAFKKYILEEENSCQAFPEPVGAKYVREVRSVVGKMMNLKVHEVENKSGKKYYTFEIVRDTGA